MTKGRSFVPAAGHDLFLPLYDPIQKLFGGEAALAELIDAAGIVPGHHVLDIGCGTGSLIVEIARRHPGARLVGLDPDPRALRRARRKAKRAGVEATFDEGFSDSLPYDSASFDRVFSSFMLHHLDAAEKAATVAEVRRVLRPGGSFHLLDFSSVGTRADGRIARWLHADTHLHDNASDRIVELLARSGFRQAREVSHRSTFFGRLGYFGHAVDPVATRAG